MRQTDTSIFYQLYFQAPGVAEAELERDPRDTMRRVLYSCSGEYSVPAGAEPLDMIPKRGGFLTRMVDPPALPSWLMDEDIAFYAGEFARTGFRGSLNWYRNIDRNWELLAPFAKAQVLVPALYVAGDRDLVVHMPRMGQLIANLKFFVPNLKRTIMLEGCGHWTQQERADEVNAALVDFLRGVGW